MAFRGVLKEYGVGEIPAPRVGRPVADPLRLLTVSLRSEEDYDRDPEAAAGGLGVIESAFDCLGGNPWLFLTSMWPDPKSRVRTKKGLLWKYPKLRPLEVRRGEIERGEGRSSLVSLVDLHDYDFDHSDPILTNWVCGLLIVSELEVDELFAVAQRWVKNEDGGAFPLDMDEIFADLATIAPTVLLRYFGADNGQVETLAVAGHKRWITDEAVKCLGNNSV